MTEAFEIQQDLDLSLMTPESIGNRNAN